MRRPRVQVVLGDPAAQPGDLVIVPSRTTSFREPRTLLVEAPQWGTRLGSDVALANAYRAAMAAAADRDAQAIVLPAVLARGTWPLDELTRVAMTVLMSTPTPVKDVTIAVPTAAVLEVWAEALVRER